MTLRAEDKHLFVVNDETTWADSKPLELTIETSKAWNNQDLFLEFESNLITSLYYILPVVDGHVTIPKEAMVPNVGQLKCQLLGHKFGKPHKRSWATWINVYNREYNRG